MKKQIFLFFFFLGVLAPVIEARGVNQNSIRKEVLPTVQAIKEEIKPTTATIRNQLRELINQASTPAERKEIQNEIREQNKGVLDQIKNRVKEEFQNLRYQARIKGTISEIDNKSMIVKGDDEVNYEVLINENTQLRRRFWGKAEISEFSVSDQVLVIGKFINEEKTKIEAILIRNLSIQKRWGVFFGEVLTISENYLVIKTITRGNLTVYLSGQIKLINRKEEPIRLSDIQPGHRVRVKGVWDKEQKEVKEVSELKNFSLKN